MSAALNVHSVSVVYGKGKSSTRAVHELSFDIEKGEVFGLLGPNGAGKTSLISVITGLVRASSGECRVFDWGAGSVEARRKIGYVPQELVNHGFFNVEEILQYYSGYYGLSQNQERIDYLLDRLSLTSVKNRKVNALSGGMKRRLLICKALVHSPELLLLDEPSAGVDIELRSQLWQFVRELNEAGTTILLTTHYLEEAQRLCDRVGIMDHGKLLALDTTGHLISSMAQKVLRVKLREGAPALKRPTAATDLQCVQAGDREWKFEFPSSMSLKEVAELSGLDWSQVEDFSMDSGSLEDAFLKVLKRVQS